MGAHGLKRSHHLIEGEGYRRIMSGEAPATLSVFSQQLADWLRGAHPEVPPITQIEVEDQIRDTWHRRHEMIRGGS